MQGLRQRQQINHFPSPIPWNSLAKSGYLTGGKLELQNNSDPKAQVTGDTKLSELGFTGKGTINLTIGDGSDGITPIIVVIVLLFHFAA